MPPTQDPIVAVADVLLAAGLDGSTAERDVHGRILIRLTPDDTAILARLLNLEDPFLPMDLPPLGVKTVTCCVTPETTTITLTDANARLLATIIRYAV